jgi:hypothetical protein
MEMRKLLTFILMVFVASFIFFLPSTPCFSIPPTKFHGVPRVSAYIC